MLLAARQLRIAQLISSGGASGTPAITDRYPALTPAGMGAGAGQKSQIGEAGAGQANGRPIGARRDYHAGDDGDHRDELLPGDQPPRGHAITRVGRRCSSTAVIALATGEITWALNYWPLNGLFAGAFLLASYYFLAGTLSSHLQSRLTTRLVATHRRGGCRQRAGRRRRPPAPPRVIRDAW